MRSVHATLQSIAPYSQSRHYSTEHPKREKEQPADYERRTWMHRCHVNKDGNVFIPPMAFKNCLAEAAKFLSVKIPGERNATWTKHFEAGLMVPEEVIIGRPEPGAKSGRTPIRLDDVKGEWLFVPSDGRRGGGSRVDKCFPCIYDWIADVTFYVLDDKITKEAFEYHLKEAGNLIGIGRFRPRNNGYYGRFKVLSLSWGEV